MSIFSSSTTSSSSKFTLFSPSQNPNYSKFHLITPLKAPNSSPPHRVLLHIHSHDSSSPPALQENPQNSASKAEMEEYGDGFDEEIIKAKKSLEELLVVRRPVMEEPRGEADGGSGIKLKENAASSKIDQGLSRFAKKMPIFEPKLVEPSSEEKLLFVNLDLALYKAKLLARNYRFQEAEEILGKCINYWPEDGRPYVALGKTLCKQSKMNEARAVYEKGCQATQGENSYIWQCWAVLESRMGNIRRARELFDAATVADKKHIAAWHGWAVMEMKEGNIKKARHLLGKALKFCGGNEYIYQTLALLEVRSKRYEQARYLFKQATKCNPRSCASWLAWAQLEAKQENIHAARRLFEKAVQSSPKNRFAWHVWGVFEGNIGNVDLARKLMMIGHAVNPRDPVLLQSLALLEYRYSTANLARVLFKRASELDSRHQPVWFAWGWMEWKEGNLAKARELYLKALSIDSTTESAARCLQAWGVLEQRVGNLSAARRLFRSSLNINSQSYVTWMTWASLEEDQGNSIRAEEIRNLYFQQASHFYYYHLFLSLLTNLDINSRVRFLHQRTEIVDDASWIMGFLDIIDPAVDSIKRLLNLEKGDATAEERFAKEQFGGVSADNGEGNAAGIGSGFDLDEFVRQKLSLDPSNLEVRFAPSSWSKSSASATKVGRSESNNATAGAKE